MNYLGHLYFSNNDPALMLGNLLGDFVKGSNFSPFHPSLHPGIVLHRKIDQFIDSHPAVITLNRKLYNELPKVSGITIDIVFDHLLATKWEKYHTEDLHNYLDEFFTYSLQQKIILPPPYFQLIERLHSYKMLHQYTEEMVIDRIANHLQSKLSFETELPKSRTIFTAYKTDFEEAFDLFMNDAVDIFLPKK